MSLEVRLRESVNEKDVENSYRAELIKEFVGGTITSPFQSDGLLEYENIKTLLEFKYGKDLKNVEEQASVFAQVLFYLKRFELSGERMPNTVFVGDDTECLALSTDVLDKYLRKSIDWSSAPSKAYKINPELVKEIAEDKEILSYVFDIGVDDFRDVVNKIEELAEGVVTLVPINQSNIVEAFRYWKENILNDGTKTTQEEVNVFIKCLIDREDTYEHPRKKGVLVTSVEDRNIEVRVKMKAHLSFFTHFKRDYKPSERKEIVENKDRLVDEIDRRKTGEFFTPTIWAREAHKTIQNNLGDNWKEEYVIWDCASGTNNLTRDLRVKELYCSTLNEEDIDTAKKMGYNPEAVFFQFDFLNDKDDKLPDGLRKALKEGKVLFLINPPYATASNRVLSEGNKTGVGDTVVRGKMREDGMGRESQQLYMQFMYRIMRYMEKGTDGVLAIYSKTSFMTSGTYRKFRERFYKQFKYGEGFMFKASEFSDVSDLWGVSFTLWEKNTKGIAVDNKVDLKTINKDTFKVDTEGEKVLYNSDNNQASRWVREPVKRGLEVVECLPLTSAVNVKTKGEVRCKTLPKEALGYFNTGGNSVMQNNMMVGLYTAGYSNGNGVPIIEDNFERVVNLFTARRCITGTYANWVNDKDEYLVPHEDMEGYRQWSRDAMVYSLFNTASYQSSLREVEYGGENWDIENEFFFLSNGEMASLADEHHFLGMYNDANLFKKDRYVNRLLESLKLSDDARAILMKARELVRESMEYRKESHELRPEYHLNAWDAGWNQIRRGILEHYPKLSKEYQEFRLMYKDFEDRLREGIYDYGFLKR